MNELADPTPTEGQAAEAPVESPTPDFELGAGMFDAGTPQEAPEVEQGHPAEVKSTETKPSDVPEDIEELRKGYLRQADYTRKTQDVSDRGRELEAREQALREREQALIDRLSQQNPEPVAQTDNLSQLLQDPSLDPQSRAGVMVLQQQAETIQSLETRLTQALEQLERFGPQLEQTAQVASQVSEERANALKSQASEQLNEAVEKLGEDVVRQYGALIKQNFFPTGDLNSWNPPTDPATGEPLSMAQFAARVSGRAGEEVQQAASEAQAAQRVAKANASPRNVSASPDVSSINGKQDALDAIRRIREGRAA